MARARAIGSPLHAIMFKLHSICTPFSCSPHQLRRSHTMVAPLKRPLVSVAAASTQFASRALLLPASYRCLSILNRPPPNYEGHVPLTRLERFGLAVGSGVLSFLDPRRGGMIQNPSSYLFSNLSIQTLSQHSAKQQPNHISSTPSETACSSPQPVAVSYAIVPD